MGIAVFSEWVRRFAKLSGSVVFLSAATVLVGWAIDAPLLKSVSPSWPPMAPITAFVFALAGVALTCASATGIHPAGHPAGTRVKSPYRRISQIGAATVILIGLFRLGEYLPMWDLNIEHLLFREVPGTSDSTNMPPATAWSFLLVGSALFLATRYRYTPAFQILTLVAAVIGWLGLSRYLFGGEALFPYSDMAIQTALLFLILSAGILCLRIDGGLMALLTSDSLGGLMARRLVPATLVVPIVLRWLRMEGQLAGWYKSQAGWSLFALGNMLVFGGLIWAASAMLHRTDSRRKEAELAVRAQQQLLEAIADGSMAVIYVKDLNGCYLLINRRYEELFHVRRDAIAGKTDYDLFSKENADAFRAVDQKVASSGAALEVEEVVPQDDGLHTYLSIKYPLRDTDGYLYAVCGISTDITERKRAEGALRASEERFRTMANSAPVLIWISGKDKLCTWFNRQWLEFVGHTLEQELGNGWAEGVHVEDLDNCWQTYATAFDERRAFSMEYRLRRHDGEWRCVLDKGIPLWDAGGEFTGYIGSCVDITERRQLEEQLRQSQKMEAIGRLAGGVAHDFNNLLTVINGYSTLAMEEIAPDNRAREALNEVLKAGEHASTLTRQLLAFSRRQVLQPKVLDVNAIVEHNSKILRRVIGEDIELVTSLDPGVRPIKADAGQIEQILMNLAVNSRDAMPRGGRLTIETGNVHLGETYADEQPASAAGDFVMIAVTDTGCGMDKATQSRIFEPFFTTKALAGGTGLGLSTVYGIVKQNGGNIWVHSEPGKGTTFKAYFPWLEEPKTSLDEPAMLVDIPAGSETILVVEDDSMVRELVCAILDKAGYQVISACHGGEALQICEEHRNRIGLVLTDMVMPEMSGPALVTKLRELNAGTRVLYTSGYAGDAVGRHGYVDTFPFIEKPFTAGDLLNKVRGALDSPIVDNNAPTKECLAEPGDPPL